MQNKLKEIIYNIFDIFKSSVPYKDYNIICIYFIFIKYILDNRKLTSNEIIFDLQEMFQKMKINGYVLIKATTDIEKIYNLPKNSLAGFIQEYLSINNINNSYDILNNLLGLLNEVSFFNSGTEIVQILKEVLYSNTYNSSKFISDKISNKSLSILIKKLLNVKDGDFYGDFTCGMGLSTLEITKNVNCYITGYEVNRSSICIAEMLTIMSEKEHFEFNMVDILECKIMENRFDKIATMPPWGIKIKNITSNFIDVIEKFDLPQNQISMETLIILKSILSLKDNGILITTVPISFLSSNNIMEREVRNLLTNKYLNAIIYLPSLYYSSNSYTIVLILKKQRDNKNILFIDASTNNFFEFSKKTNKSVTNLTNEAINKIKQIYDDNLIIDGISNLVDIKTIKENKYIFSVSKYIKNSKEKNFISNKEIDERLNFLYSEVKKIIENRLY